MIQIQLTSINYVIYEPFHLFPLYIPLYHHNIPMLSCFVGIDMEIPAFVDHEKREQKTCVFDIYVLTISPLYPDYITTVSPLLMSTCFNVHISIYMRYCLKIWRAVCWMTR